MSDRDDIDVIGNAENNAEPNSAEVKQADNNSTDSSSNNQAIRQNPLTHSDEKPPKKGFFEKLKRAFSTEDSSEEQYEDTSDGGLVEDGDGMGGIMNMFKKKKANSDEAENNVENKSVSDNADLNITDKNNNTENTEKPNARNSQPEENSAETAKSSEAEFDPEEEEEFKMISAFLEGEEYIPTAVSEEKKTENFDAKTDETENSDAVTAENKKEIEPDEVRSEENKPVSENDSKKAEYDSQNALENEEANFDVQNAFENEEAEFIMIDIDDEAELSDDFEEISEETKTEESTEIKSEETKTEESTEIKSEETKSEESTKIKSEEIKTEESTEIKSEEIKTEESTEIKSEEIKTEESTEIKSEEIKTEESTEIKSEEIKTAESTEIKSEEIKTEESTEIKPEETKSEEPTEIKSEETKTEEPTEIKPEETKSEEPTEIKSEETKSEEQTEIKPNKNSDGIEVEIINAEGNKIGSDDDLDDEDEDFRFDDDYVFDESDDDDLEDLANLDDVDDFKDLEGLFNTSQNPKDNSADSKSNEISEEITNAENIENAVNTENTQNTENTENGDKPEAEEKSVEESDTTENSDKPEQENSAENTEVKAEENGEEKTETEEKNEVHDEIVDISSKSGSGESGADDVKKKKGAAFGKLKTAILKTKNKIVELWNTKEDGTVEENGKTPDKTETIKTEPAAEISESVSENTETADAKQNENVIDITAVTHSDTSDKNGNESENTEIIAEKGENDNAAEMSENDNVSEFKDDNTSKDKDAKPKIIPMTVIKNENAAVVPIDREKVRESLSVIEIEKTSPEPDILTDEQKHQLEMNRKVLEKVKQYEEETAEKREILRKERAERSAKDYKKAFGTVDPITEIEIDNYLDGEPQEVIKVKAGKFTESVKSEYEFYVGYTKLKNVAKNQTKVEPAKSAQETQPPVQGKPYSAEKAKLDEKNYAEFAEDKFAKSRDRLESISKRLDYKDSKHPEIPEYRTEDDAVKIRKLLQENLKKAKAQWNMSVGLTFAMFVLCCIGGLFTVGAGEEAKDGAMRGFAFVNLAIYAAMLYNCRDIILRGLQPLKKIKSNSDTGYAVAAIVTAFQSVLALITPTPFFCQGLNVYTIVVMLALALNTLGRQRNADRIFSNFRFVSDSSQKYTGKFFHDQRMVATLLSGTRNDKSELVFQKKTAFLKHFMKLSNSPDPGEGLADKFSLPTIVFSLIISIVYLFLSKSFADSVSVLTIMLCAAVPMCSKALGAVPLHKLAKNSLANQSMVVGYQAVDSFSESAAVMLDAKELYPEGSVHLNGIKTFDSRRIDDAMLAAASVIITAGGAMAGMFDGIIQGDKQENLPTAENVIYEDGKGLIGWVNNERIFIGNRQLLMSHGIEPMSEEYEEEQKSDGDEILYLACAGELVAMFIVGYSANRRVADALRRMEANGMSMLIRTTDVNITAERIAKDFGVSHRSIKILEQKNSNVVRDEMIGKEKSSPAFVATKGGVTSFGRAVSGCIQTKRNISLSLAVQVFGVLLGLLIVTVIALVSGVHHIGAIQMFFFYLFWVAAIIAAPYIVQKFQKF